MGGVWLSALLAAASACGGPANTAPSAIPVAASCAAPVPPPRLPALACPSAADVAAIDRDVRLLFEEDPTWPTLVCTAASGSADLTRLQERAYQALILMRRLQFDRPLPWTTRTLYEWFVGAVGGVLFRGSRSFCCGADRVINIGVGTQYDAGFPSLIEGLVHEARHADGLPHTCRPVQGIGQTADRRPEDVGAFGAQYYLLRWIADHETSGLDPAWRQIANLRSAELRSGAFCEVC